MLTALYKSPASKIVYGTGELLDYLLNGYYKMMMTT